MARGNSIPWPHFGTFSKNMSERWQPYKKWFPNSFRKRATRRLMKRLKYPDWDPYMKDYNELTEQDIAAINEAEELYRVTKEIEEADKAYAAEHAAKNDDYGYAPLDEDDIFAIDLAALKYQRDKEDAEEEVTERNRERWMRITGRTREEQIAEEERGEKYEGPICPVQ